MPMILISKYMIVNILIGQRKGVNMCEDIWKYSGQVSVLKISEL